MCVAALSGMKRENPLELGAALCGGALRQPAGLEGPEDALDPVRVRDLLSRRRCLFRPPGARDLDRLDQNALDLEWVLLEGGRLGNRRLARLLRRGGRARPVDVERAVRADRDHAALGE